jgi:hypothetical protein
MNNTLNKKEGHLKYDGGSIFYQGTIQLGKSRFGIYRFYMWLLMSCVAFLVFYLVGIIILYILL